MVFAVRLDLTAKVGRTPHELMALPGRLNHFDRVVWDSTRYLSRAFRRSLTFESETQALVSIESVVPFNLM